LLSLHGEQAESHTSWAIATSQPDRKILVSLDARGVTVTYTVVEAP